MSEWIKKLTEKYAEVNENQNAAMQKKLAKASASSEKGKAAVTLKKAPFEIPEDVPMDERDMFMAKAAAAHKAGKTHFTMPGGKKHAVTMKKDTADAVNEYAPAPDAMKKKKMEMSSKEKMKKGLYNGAKDEVEMNPKKKQDKNATTSADNMAAEETLPPVYARILENRAAHYKGATPPETMDDKFKGDGAKKAKSDIEKGSKVDDTEEKGHDDASKAGRAGPKAPARRNDNMKGDKSVINPAKDTTKG